VPYNLHSPNGILEPLDPTNVARWFVRETLQIESEPIRTVLHQVAGNLNDFVCWPKRALLLWAGCDRVTPEGKRQRYHQYPVSVRELAKKSGVNLDTRPNGPATAAFQLAGGRRPERFGSSNAWSTHHIYSGKFPYLGRAVTTHATKSCKHFTQSAGLIAAHPVADALCDELPFFAWLLRFESFHRFGYDPDGVFSPHQDEFGFSDACKCEVFSTEVLGVQAEPSSR
jgi:hypothetical protein